MIRPGQCVAANGEVVTVAGTASGNIP